MVQGLDLQDALPVTVRKRTGKGAMGTLVLGLLMAPLACGCEEASGLGGRANVDAGEDVAVDTGDHDPRDPYPDIDWGIPDTGMDPHSDPDADDAGWPDSTTDPWADADPECPPPRDDVESVFMIDDTPFPFPPVDVRELCSITSITGTSVIMISLDCGSSVHSIEFRPYPPVRLEWRPDTAVIFRHVVSTPSETPYWVNRWFSLESGDGKLIMAGIDADSLAPPGTSDADWYDPLDPNLDAGGCLWESLACYDNERLDINLDYWGVPWEYVTVWDRGEGWIGVGNPFQIRVGEASMRRSLRCPETPERWFSMVLARQFG